MNYRIKTEHMFLKGDTEMSKNKIELLKLIFENDNPEEVILTALDVVTSFLKQPESYQAPSVDFLQELFQTNQITEELPIDLIREVV